ncbi:DUF3572 domain-containing protein [Shimia biformata]|uniref:DUF3572 domain-containing protein n=1 Tax=Shimia biformata TaxID=1294299 RepID=UPI00194DD9F9|nr:DUF3572 domain-containing protein [Shimia biformata]
MSMTEDAAELLALRALGWLAGNDELLGVFLGASGASVDDLKSAATDRAFLGSVLGFLTMDDAWVVAFCDTTGDPYEAPMIASAVLAGEAGRHWT